MINATVTDAKPVLWLVWLFGGGLYLAGNKTVRRYFIVGD
jgi:hypothetical protein